MEGCERSAAGLRPLQRDVRRALKQEENIPVAVFGLLENLNLSDRFCRELPDRRCRVIQEGLRTGRENVVVALSPRLTRQRVGAKDS